MFYTGKYNLSPVENISNKVREKVSELKIQK